MRTPILLALNLALLACVPTTGPDRKYLEEDGFFLTSYEDGSAGVHLGKTVYDFSWSIDCRVDSMSDRRSCSIKASGGELLVYYGTAGQPQEICIIGHDFPGRRGMIRVDKNQPVSTGLDGCVPASRLLSQLKRGTTVSFRYYEWPYDYSKDAQHTLRGLGKAMEVVQRIRSGSMPVVH